MLEKIKSLVDENNGYLEIGNVFFANGEDEEGNPEGEYFELLAIIKRDGEYICIMNSEDEEWSLNDFDDDELSEIIEEIF